MRPEKQLLLDDIRDRLTGATSFLVTRYQGLSVPVTNDFRSQVRQSGGDFEVVRKRVLIKAASAAKLPFDEIALEGHIGIVFTEDALATAKTVVAFHKDNAGTVELVAGWIDGVLYGAEDVARFAKLPSLEVMRSQLVGLFEAPMAQTLSVIEAVLTCVIHCLNNKAEEKS